MGFWRSRSPKLVKLRANDAAMGKARKTRNRITNGAANAHPTMSSRHRQPPPAEAALAAPAFSRLASAGTVTSAASADLLGLGLHLVRCLLRGHVPGGQLLEG